MFNTLRALPFLCLIFISKIETPNRVAVSTDWVFYDGKFFPILTVVAVALFFFTGKLLRIF